MQTLFQNKFKNVNINAYIYTCVAYIHTIFHTVKHFTRLRFEKNVPEIKITNSEITQNRHTPFPPPL